MRTGREGAYGRECIEAEDDARVSHVMGLVTDGRRVLPFGFGLVGGEAARGWARGMGLEMEETEGDARWLLGRALLSIVHGGRGAKMGESEE